MKPFVLTALLALCTSAAIGQSPASAPVSAAKKELVAKVLELHRPAVENMARTLAEQPAQRLIFAVQTSGALQRVPADKREALGKDLDADLRKYLSESTPILRERALTLMPTTMGPILEQRFSEDELRQLVAFLESPLSAKFQAAGVEMQRALGERLVADSKASIEPRLKTLEKAVNDKLNAAAGTPGRAASGAKR